MEFFKMIKLTIATLCATFLLVGCATQRYGRQTEVSGIEMKYFTCKDINIEIAKTEEFLSQVRMQRADTSGAHVLGFLGDFGIGNVLEGDAAELSGEKRLKQLRDLKATRNCQ